MFTLFSRQLLTGSSLNSIGRLRYNCAAFSKMAAPPRGPPPAPPKLPLYFVWNAFEEIPPSPDFPTFVDGWLYTAAYVQKTKRFLVTQLHENIDQEGKFKYINHAAFDGPEFPVFDGVGIKEFMEVANKGSPPNQKKLPGGYEELSTSTGKPLAPWLPRDTNSLWIVTGFFVDKEKAADVADFEKNWRASSGADFILNAPKELGITKVGLYKRFTANPPALDYVVRAEITGIKDDNVQPAVEFLKKLREVKYPSCITMADSGVYKTPSKWILYPSAEKRDPPAGFPWIPE